MTGHFAIALACGIAVAGITAPAQAVTYTVVHYFPFNGDGPSGDGANPAASLIDVGGILYGTTESGGSTGNFGTVFSWDPSTGTEQLVYSFTQGQGYDPMANLINVKGTLYGTTYGGGGSNNCAPGCGVVFSLNPATGAEQLVTAFEGSVHGKFPSAGLVQVGGKLYGTTSEGGKLKNCSKKGCGTIYTIDPKSGAEKIVYAFQNGSDGAYPYGSLINVGGILYGTTQEGGGAGFGTVFSLDTASGVEKVLYAFQGGYSGPDGIGPMAGVINIGHTLYGTTFSGGASQVSSGTVFSLNLDTGVETVLHAFQAGNDGAGPAAALIDVGGKLYGTTSGGGGSNSCGPGCGTVFSIDPAKGDEKVLYSFQGGGANDGAVPLAGLINVGGTLYGTTSAGGVTSCYNNFISGCGTVFAITP